ncbi:MAG: type II secretion system major pseudopilin GspG [Planctomycetota bacterium]|nr:type II secretion system major pseudopilin GspG [Planctomycetota bacterium]
MKIHRTANHRRAGFSLAELMVVIVIIGLLATLVVPSVIKKLFTANIGKAKGDIAVIEGALNDYAIENNGMWPESLQELVTPDENGFTFLKGTSIPLDPWRNEYAYEPPTPGQTVPTITCYGADGVPGGEGQDQDFTNHMIRSGEI